MDSYIRLESVVKNYTKEGDVVCALDIPELDVPKEGVVLVRGASGAGKTTLLNLMGLLDRPSSGEVFISGKPVNSLSDDEKSGLRRKLIGFIFQSYNLIPTLNVVENIQLSLLAEAGLDNAKSQMINQMLSRVGLEKKRHHLPAELSGWEQQRVAILRALVNEPKVILADEPTAHLDPENARLILDILLGLTQERKILLLISVNDKLDLHGQECRELCLKQGRLQ